MFLSTRKINSRIMMSSIISFCLFYKVAASRINKFIMRFNYFSTVNNLSLSSNYSKTSQYYFRLEKERKIRDKKKLFRTEQTIHDLYPKLEIVFTSHHHSHSLIYNLPTARTAATSWSSGRMSGTGPRGAMLKGLIWVWLLV